MVKKSYRLLVVLCALALSMAASAKPGPREYVASLETLNGSGVTGEARLTLDGNRLTVQITATGLEPGKLHPQHIHGFGSQDDGKSDQNSFCPTEAADANGDGLVSLEEGLPSYGPVMLALTPFPTAPNGTIEYERTFVLSDEDVAALMPLQKRAIVLHGLTVDGQYVATLPVACGTIQVAAPGRDKDR